jgi:hypothetical protein
VNGRNILTDPTGEEGIVLKPEPSKAPVHTKNAKGRDGPIAPIRREEGLVQILEVSQAPVHIKSVKGRNILTDPTECMVHFLCFWSWVFFSVHIVKLELPS